MKERCCSVGMLSIQVIVDVVVVAVVVAGTVISQFAVGKYYYLDIVQSGVQHTMRA